MTYIPRAVVERQKWLTLPEALAHIIEVENCTPNDAWGQLLDALSDEAVRVVWELSADQLNSEDPAYQSIFPRHPAMDLWMTTSISSDGRRICFPNSFPIPIEKVWLFKESVLEIWKKYSSEVKRAEKASDDEVLEALRDIFKDVASGIKKRWDLNDLHKWVELSVDPKKRPKKEVWEIFRKAPEFAEYQREKGRPRDKKTT
jgi:hypothetical protein